MKFILGIIKNIYGAYTCSRYRRSLNKDCTSSLRAISYSVIISIQDVMAECEHILFFIALQVCSTQRYLGYICLSL